MAGGRGARSRRWRVAAPRRGRRGEAEALSGGARAGRDGEGAAMGIPEVKRAGLSLAECREIWRLCLWGWRNNTDGDLHDHFRRRVRIAVLERENRRLAEALRELGR